MYEETCTCTCTNSSAMCIVLHKRPKICNSRTEIMSSGYVDIEIEEACRGISFDLLQFRASWSINQSQTSTDSRELHCLQIMERDIKYRLVQSWNKVQLHVWGSRGQTYMYKNTGNTQAPYLRYQQMEGAAITPLETCFFIMKTSKDIFPL